MWCIKTIAAMNEKATENQECSAIKDEIMPKLTEEQTKTAVAEWMNGVIARFKQELDGENEEFLDRIIWQHRARIARISWKSSQKWSKWTDEGPVLMPDYTRIYYRKGKTEVLLQEFPPQTRLLKFRNALALRENSTDNGNYDRDGVCQFSLALPYVIFIFKFREGMFKEVRCAFSDRPLKKLEEKPLRPYLSNLDSNLVVCLGSSFPSNQLESGNVSQQSALVLSHFWHSVFSDEWSGHYWGSKTHFQANDQRLASLQQWQDASVENSLFVVDDVNWLPHTEENFGDIMVRMFEDDSENVAFHEDLYKQLVEEFLEDVKKTLTENMGTVGDRLVQDTADNFTKELVAKLNGEE